MSEAAQKQAEIKIKPLSNNAFLAFFQKIWRWWLGVWYGFADKNPKLAGIIYKVFFFIIFSEGVTIWQFIVMTFLPFAFKGIWDVPFVWPAVALPWTDAAGVALNWAIFNEPVKFLVGKNVYLASTSAQVSEYLNLYGQSSLQCAGLGNFIAYEIAVFTAQCINFPLQRNITYKSKGNPVFQGFMYFVGWVVISVVVNAIWGIMNPLMLHWNWNEVVIGLIKTVLTGGLSMVVFFFIFLVIFPDLKKASKNAQKKVETLKASGASAEAIAEAEKKAAEAEKAYKLDNARKEQISAESLASAKAVSWDASVKLLEKMKTENKPAEEIEKQEKIVAEKLKLAEEAAGKRDEAIAANQAVIAEYAA